MKKEFLAEIGSGRKLHGIISIMIPARANMNSSIPKILWERRKEVFIRTTMPIIGSMGRLVLQLRQGLAEKSSHCPEDRSIGVLDVCSSSDQ